MNNGAKSSKINIKVQSLAYYSASMSYFGMSPVMRVEVSGFAKNTNVNVGISIVGKTDNGEFIHRCDFANVCINPDNYNLKTPGECVFDFDYDSFSINNAYLDSIQSEIMGQVYVLVNIDGKEYCQDVHIRLLPSDVWQGLDAEPSTIRAFMDTECQSVKKIVQSIPEQFYADYCTGTYRSFKAGIEEIYKAIKMCNIIYSRPSFYSAASMQKVKKPDELFASASILATPVELALLFCACAQNCGYDTSLLFVSGASGVVRVACGVYLVKDAMDKVLTEDAESIKQKVEYSELLVVEPSVFATAQNTSFSLACSTFKSQLCSGEVTLECMINMPCQKDKQVCSPDAKKNLAGIYSMLMNRPVMKMLSGNDADRFVRIPLLTAEFDRFYNSGEDFIKLCPLEYNVNLLDFASLDKDFSSVITAKNYGQKFSTSEKEACFARFESFKQKITRDDGVVTSLGEEKLYDAACKLTYCKGKEKPYAVFGFVRIKDKLTDLVSFAPICLVELEMKSENASFSFRQNSKPVVNKLFIRNAMKNAGLGYDSFMKATMPTDKKEIFDMFENIRSALCETDDRYSYEIIREIHLIGCDMTDFNLWCDIALERREILSSSAGLCALGLKYDKEYLKNNNTYPVSKCFYNQLCAVRTDSDMVISGPYSQPKLDTLSSITARQITEGKTTLVVTDSKQQSELIKENLVSSGMQDAVLAIDSFTKTQDVCKEISQLLEKYSAVSENNVALYPQDLALIENRLEEYTTNINKKHSLGMSLQEAVCFYFEALNQAKDVPELPIDESVLEDCDQNTLDKLFDCAGNIVTKAHKLCKLSQMNQHLPISSHALFDTDPEERLSLNQCEQIKELVAKALPVLSEFRDIFYDVSNIIGIDQNQVKTIESAFALNELYKLVLSAREAQIPEDFFKTDIDTFSNSINGITAVKKRMKALEFKLGFFSHEIFEDILSILPGNEYEDEEKGFFKKFRQKKSGYDTLLQYVDNENRAAFQQRKLEDVYKLLYEYKACVQSIQNSENKDSDENTANLAHIAANAGELIDAICGHNRTERQKRLSGVFKLITIIPVDASLARNMTITRARFAELYSGENSVFSQIENLLGMELSKLEFDNGVFAFDGLSEYLKNIVEKLDCMDAWKDWLEFSSQAKLVLPSFVEYVEKHGTSNNAENIFAKSIMLPVVKKIRKDFLPKAKDEQIFAAKEKYISLFERACELAKYNLEISYSQSARHCAKTNSTQSVSNIEHGSIKELLEKEKTLVSKIKPVIIVTLDNLTTLISKEYDFDNVVILDNSQNGFACLPCFAFAKRAIVCNMSANSQSTLLKQLCKNGVRQFNVGTIYGQTNNSFSAFVNSFLFNENNVYYNTQQGANVEIIRMNGIFDRKGNRINKTEAELVISKTTELLNLSPKTTVAVTAFTLPQCEYIEKLAHSMCKKNAVLSHAINEGKVVFSTPDRLYLKEYDCIVVSTCFGLDKDVKAGWDFGFADCVGKANLADAYVSISDKNFEKMYLITSLNEKTSRLLSRTGKNAYAFNSICELLTDGRIPFKMDKSYDIDTDSFVQGLMNAIGCGVSKMSVCQGKNAFGATLFKVDDIKRLAVFVDNDKNTNMHDELILKSIISSKGFETMTLSPVSFADEHIDAFVSAFRV